VEATPDAGKFTIPQRAVYNLTVESTPTSFTTRRTYVLGDILFNKTEYPMLRTFYSQFEAKDQESVVLKVLPSSAATTADAPKGN
jgi:hypothetical protein